MNAYYTTLVLIVSSFAICSAISAGGRNIYGKRNALEQLQDIKEQLQDIKTRLESEVAVKRQKSLKDPKMVRARHLEQLAQEYDHNMLEDVKEEKVAREMHDRSGFAHNKITHV